MDELAKLIKKRLSADNLIEIMKEAKVIDENKIKEEDVRRTLDKIDPNQIVDVDEMAAKLSEISEQSRIAAAEAAATKAAMDNFNVLSKSPNQDTPKKEEDEGFLITDNITGFLD